jgi:hypothetical protein
MPPRDTSEGKFGVAAAATPKEKGRCEALPLVDTCA